MMEKESHSMPDSTAGAEQFPPNNPNPGLDLSPKSDPKFPDPTPSDGGNIGSFVMGSDSQSESLSQIQTQSDSDPSENRFSPSGSKKSVHWSPELVPESQVSQSSSAMGGLEGSNPYIARTPAPPAAFSFKESVDTVRGVLERWGKRVGEATKKAEDLAGNTWQHLKTSPSFAEAAMGRIAQGTKVLAEGGYDKIFRQAFETDPEEQLLSSFACYLSTSAGPVMGVLYVSTAKLAFSSDNPLSYKSGAQTEWSYYKVLIPLHQLKSVHPSSGRANPYEKYIQVSSVDNHEFWFMGFLYYDSAMECLLEAIEARNLQTV